MVQRHINAIGRDPYPIDLDPHIMQVTVSRQFMSAVYGGSAQSLFPKIGKKKLEKHGYDNFFYLRLQTHPHGPHQPGHPGLWFLQEVGNWVNKEELRTFVCIAPNKWLYVGQYLLTAVQPLSQEEWIVQKDSVCITHTNVLVFD